MVELKKKRKALGLTQVEMAKTLGITQTAYGNYELGKRNPKPEMLCKMSQVLKCTVDELLKGSEDARA